MAINISGDMETDFSFLSKQGQISPLMLSFSS